MSHNLSAKIIIIIANNNGVPAIAEVYLTFSTSFIIHNNLSYRHIKNGEMIKFIIIINRRIGILTRAA